MLAFSSLDALQTYCKRWAKREGVGVYALKDLKKEFLRIIDIRIDNFTKHLHWYKQPSSRSMKTKKKTDKLHRKCVFHSLRMPIKQRIT